MQAAPSLRVLVAEDSAVVRNQLETLFGGIGGVELVGLVEDGDAALSAITERGPDVVVLDLRMPGKNGLEVLRAVRATFAGKVIMLTNFADPLTRRLCFEAGADHFFDKSTEFRQMLRVVRELRDQGDHSTSDPA
jgi:CheY-like chemotaxis protein